jgi:alpha-N-arabinofuranosidase
VPGDHDTADLLDDPGVTLPDGTTPHRWDVAVAHSRTIHVDQHAPEASDEGPGTAERPFLTIGRAAAEVGPGERVLVHGGIYRDTVRPVRGGDGPEAMVTFEATPGGGVVVRGSVVLAGHWERPTEQHGSPDPIWRLDLATAGMPDDHPFLRENVDKSDPTTYQASVPEQITPADVHRRGLLFQNGRRLTQVSTIGDLASAAGTYWVEPDGWHVVCRPFGAGDPNTVVMEATDRAQLFAPDGPGVSYVCVRGFVFEHVGNGFSYPVEAAVSPMGGHHWLIEDNAVQHVNSDAITIGSHLWEIGGNPAAGFGQDCIVRGNLVHDCGVSGLKGLTPNRCIVEDNVFDGIGWQGVERWYDNGGMKLLVATDLLVRHNLLRRIHDAPGIWLDWDIVNSRVAQNVLLDVRGEGGAIFMEACVEPNWVDRNVVCGIEGNGIYQQDADRLEVFENVIGDCTGSGVLMRVCTERPIRGRQVTCRDNRVHDNLVIGAAEAVTFGDPDNWSGRNAVGGDLSRAPEDRPVALDLVVDEAPAIVRLQWKAADPLVGGTLPPPLDGLAGADGEVVVFAVRTEAARNRLHALAAAAMM